MAAPNDWHHIQQEVVQNLRTARHHLWGNVAVYLGLFLVEYIYARIGHSQTLQADAFNNLSGIISTGLLLTGLFIATETHDDDLLGAPISPAEQKSLGPRIQQSRFRFETVYTLIAGVIMIAIALEIIGKGVWTLLHPADIQVPLPIAGVGAGISGLALFILWGFNHYWSRKLNNAALIAASRDTFSDALTSLVTVLTVLGTTGFKVDWLDSLASICLGIYIMHSGLKIFSDSSLNLVDYFDPYLEEQYQYQIESLPAVQAVTFLKAHYDGNLIMLDVTIAVDGQMTANAIYDLSQHINTILWAQFGVMETDVITVPINKTGADST
ncbi:cation diffusion facilitator family transporter [Lactiplantibacillus daowaiensis]|uniref:Cation diffusion facilitator family transporter n=1 Tax=Lactiplantibacillus daowaiensis TaxID=2559918 RepID=A0ABW1S172_9LACO|nr:cation diffusion facilitator family transporter [Lactiplantibacillus daowaiensis]